MKKETIEKIISTYYRSPLIKLGVDLGLGVSYGMFQKNTGQSFDIIDAGVMIVVPIATAFVPANIAETTYSIKINPKTTQLLAAVGEGAFLVGDMVGRIIATYL